MHVSLIALISWAIGLFAGLFIASYDFHSNKICAQSVVHKGNAVCAVFINKDLADAIK